MGHLKTTEDQERVTSGYFLTNHDFIMICQKIPKTAAKLPCSQLAACLALKKFVDTMVEITKPRSDLNFTSLSP